MANSLKQNDDKKRLARIEGFRENYRSYMGYSFSCYDDSWQVCDSKYIDVSILSSIDLPFIERQKLRHALARLTTKRSHQTILSYLTTLRELKLLGFSDISSEEIHLRSSELARQHIKNLKALLKELAYFDQSYIEVRNSISTLLKAKKKPVPEIFDIEKGALNEFELTDLAEKMNRYSDLLLSDSLNLKPHVNRTPLGTWTYFIGMRFLLSFSRRPIQVAALKWKDIVLQETQTGLRIKVRMPMGKQRTGFREKFEDIRLTLSDEFSREVAVYKTQYESELRKSFDLEFTAKEASQLIQELPIIPHHSLWSFACDSKQDFFTHLSEEQDRFHCESIHVGRLIRNLFVAVSFKPESNRVPIQIYKYGVNRLRHTTGSMMAAQGYSILEIAATLGNSVSAAKCYVDLTDEVRASIDSSFESGSMLKKSFSGYFTDRVSDGEVGIEDEHLGILGKSADLKSCIACVQTRPIACYGCNYFRPLVGANHRAKLNDLEVLVASRTQNGVNRQALSGLKRALVYIRATIRLCEEYVSMVEK